MKVYINENLINKRFGYLENLIKIIKDIPKKIFYEIIIYIIEKCYENGIKCIRENIKFCRYFSLFFFQKSQFYFN